jgi:hypothetical protein
VSRFAEERALPPIFGPDGYSPARIEWYTRLVIASEVVRGGVDVIPELIAAMIGESNLDNLAIGNNAAHGSDNVWLGVSWMQLDTGYHVADLETLHAFREDPLRPLVYVAGNADLCDQGGTSTHFNRQRWHAWDPETIDPDEGWNPLRAAHDAYERVSA